MAGYHNFSKSNNAIEAEYNGRYVMTKAKRVLSEKIGITQKDASVLLELYWCGEYHHTSKFYNEVNYYDIRDTLLQIVEIYESNLTGINDIEGISEKTKKVLRDYIVNTVVDKYLKDDGVEHVNILDLYIAENKKMFNCLKREIITAYNRILKQEELIKQEELNRNRINRFKSMGFENCNTTADVNVFLKSINKSLFFEDMKIRIKRSDEVFNSVDEVIEYMKLNQDTKRN